MAPEVGRFPVEMGRREAVKYYPGNLVSMLQEGTFPSKHQHGVVPQNEWRQVGCRLDGLAVTRRNNRYLWRDTRVFRDVHTQSIFSGSGMRRIPSISLVWILIELLPFLDGTQEGTHDNGTGRVVDCSSHCCFAWFHPSGSLLSPPHTRVMYHDAQFREVKTTDGDGNESGKAGGGMSTAFIYVVDVRPSASPHEMSVSPHHKDVYYVQGARYFELVDVGGQGLLCIGETLSKEDLQTRGNFKTKRLKN